MSDKSYVMESNVVRLLPVPGKKVIVATTTMFGKTLNIKLVDVIKRKLMPLQEASNTLKLAGLVGVTAAPFDTFMHEVDGANQAVAVYYQRDEADDMKEVAVTMACEKIGTALGQIFSTFNDQRGWIYECFPNTKGSITSSQAFDSVVTDHMKREAIRMYLEQQPLVDVLEKTGVPRDRFTGVSAELIAGEKKFEEEFKCMQPIEIVSTQGKVIGVGYVSTDQEIRCSQIDSAQVYYPDGASSYYIVINDTGKAGSDRFAMFVLETCEEVIETLERTLGHRLTLSSNRQKFTSRIPIPALLQELGAYRVSLADSGSTQETLKDRCRQLGISGYSNKDVEQIRDMIAEGLSERMAEQECPLKGNYIVLPLKQGANYGFNHVEHHVPIISRICGSKAFIADRDPIVDDSKLDSGGRLVDMYNPFEEGFKLVSACPEEKTALSKGVIRTDAK